MKRIIRVGVLFALLGLLLGCDQATPPAANPTDTLTSATAPTALPATATTSRPPTSTATTAPTATNSPQPTTPAATSTPDPTAAPAETEVTPSSTVTIPGSDGLALIGTFQTGSGDAPRPTLLLLHMLGSQPRLRLATRGRHPERGRLQHPCPRHARSRRHRRWS